MSIVLLQKCHKISYISKPLLNERITHYLAEGQWPRQLIKYISMVGLEHPDLRRKEKKHNDFKP